MNDHREKTKQQSYEDPDAAPWTALALLVNLILLCLVIAANIVLAIMHG